MVEPIHALFNLQDARGISRLLVILSSSLVLVGDTEDSRLLVPDPCSAVQGLWGLPVTTYPNGFLNQSVR